MPVFLYMFRDTIFVINIFIRVLQLTTDSAALVEHIFKNSRASVDKI